MKRIHTEAGTLLDMGEFLIIIPKAIWPTRQMVGFDGEVKGVCDDPHGQPIEVGGFSLRTTKAGREAVDVLPGTDYTLRIREGAGDRSWANWADRAPSRSAFGDVFAYAVPTSNGGGCWFEVTLVPTAGYESNYEARIADELAV